MLFYGSINFASGRSWTISYLVCIFKKSSINNVDFYVQLTSESTAPFIAQRGEKEIYFFKNRNIPKSELPVFKFNHGNIITVCEICSKLIIKTPDRRVSSVDFEQVNASWAISGDIHAYCNSWKVINSQLFNVILYRLLRCKQLQCVSLVPSSWHYHFGLSFLITHPMLTVFLQNPGGVVSWTPNSFTTSWSNEFGT